MELPSFLPPLLPAQHQGSNRRGQSHRGLRKLILLCECFPKAQQGHFQNIFYLHLQENNM